MMYENTINKLCNKHDILLLDLDADPYCIEKSSMTGWDVDGYENRSSCSGDWILLGKYDSYENKLASFFHEYAHLRTRLGSSHRSDWYEINPTKYHSEKYMWEYAFRFAKKLGMEFSDKVFEYRDSQLLTYEWYKMDEKSIKDIADNLLELGYKKEADELKLCQCTNRCENCMRKADRYQREIVKGCLVD